MTPIVDFKKQFVSPLPILSLPPLLYDWKRIPADYHHHRPPLYKDIKAASSMPPASRPNLLSEFSIESITRNEGDSINQTRQGKILVQPRVQGITNLKIDFGLPNPMNMRLSTLVSESFMGGTFWFPIA